MPGRPTGPSSPWQTSRKRAWLTQQSQAAFSVRRFGRGEKENTKKNRQRVLAKWEILLSKESHIFKNLTGPRKLNTCERSSLRDRQSRYRSTATLQLRKIPCRLDSSSEPRRWATRAGEIESSPEVLCTWSDTHRSRTSSRGGSVRTPDQDRERHTSRTSPTLSSTKRKKKENKARETRACRALRQSQRDNENSSGQKAITFSRKWLREAGRVKRRLQMTGSGKDSSFTNTVSLKSGYLKSPRSANSFSALDRCSCFTTSHDFPALGKYPNKCPSSHKRIHHRRIARSSPVAAASSANHACRSSS